MPIYYNSLNEEKNRVFRKWSQDIIPQVNSPQTPGIDTSSTDNVLNAGNKKAIAFNNKNLNVSPLNTGQDVTPLFSQNLVDRLNNILNPISPTASQVTGNIVQPSKLTNTNTGTTTTNVNANEDITSKI